MEKKDLKELVSGLNTGDTLTVTYLSTMPSDTRYDAVRGFAGQTVEYSLVETRTGRGKGGSQLMVLRTVSGDTITTGTPHSDAILNVRGPNGALVGFETEADVTKVYETDTVRALDLKKSLVALVGMTGAKVRLVSTEQEFSGDFDVLSATKLKGRYGQIRLSLRAADGQSVDLWSYRHSGIITSVEILDPGTAVVSD